MRTISLLLICSASMWAASYTASATGAWSSTATWGGHGIPGDGDTVAIGDGVRVTVTDSRTVGTSGVNGTIAINCGNSGALIVASSVALTVRGDIQYTANGGANSTAFLTLQAGSTFEWDSSAASSPTTTKYSAHPDTNYGYRSLVTTGTSNSHATVTSNAGGGNGWFGLGPGNTVGGSYNLTYTDFTRIGDATNPAFQGGNVFSQTNLTPWVATYNTFTNCGLAPSFGGTMLGEDVFQHDYNVHSETLATQIMFRGGDPANMKGLCVAAGVPVGCTMAGVREVLGNVFDVPLDNGADAGFQDRDFTFSSNYFGERWTPGGRLNYTWRYFQNNFYRESVGTDNEMFQTAGDIRDSLFFLDDPSTTNPHGLDLSPGTSWQTWFGLVHDHFGMLAASMSALQIDNLSLAPNSTFAMVNNIVLPNEAGHGTWWSGFFTNCCGNSGVTYVWNHNTVIADGGNGATVDGHPGTGYASNSGQIISLANNIMWNPVASNMSYKLYNAGGSYTNLNACLPSNCDYNDGWNMLTDGGGFTGGANGYADVFSGGTPGINDLAINPQFVDATRNVATFDTAYLGNTAAAWDGGSTYSVGAMVASSDASIYSTTAIGFPSGGAVINYRYTNGSWNGTACGGANPKPGIMTGAYALSRACWELATLYRLRQGVAAQTLCDDQTIGAHEVDIITVLIQWIRAGFSPTNEALALGGRDGQDIGAVPVTFAAPTFQNSNTAARKVIIRGGVIR